MGKVLASVPYNPLRLPASGMLSYLYIIASSYQEFHFTACLAHNVAFRRKATNFRLSSWDHIDSQSYSN